MIQGSRAGEVAAHDRLGGASARTLDDDPADESQPQAAKRRSAEDLQYAQGDEHVADDLTDGRGAACRSHEFVRAPPEQGAQDPAAVEGKAGKQVEDGQRDVG
jgi:hypothetical protein